MTRVVGECVWVTGQMTDAPKAAELLNPEPWLAALTYCGGIPRE